MTAKVDALQRTMTASTAAGLAQALLRRRVCAAAPKRRSSWCAACASPRNATTFGGLLRDDASLAECVFLAVHPTFLVAVREAEEEGSARSFWDDTNVPDDIRNEARREAKRLRTTTEEALVGHPTPIAAWLANVSTRRC